MEMNFCVMKLCGGLLKIFDKLEGLSVCLVDGINESILSLLVKLKLVMISLIVLLLGRWVKGVLMF